MFVGIFFRLLIGSSFAIVLLSPHTSSAATCEKPIAKAVSVQGSVEAQRVGETQWQQVKLNDTFCPGDKLRSNKRSRAEVATGQIDSPPKLQHDPHSQERKGKRYRSDRSSPGARPISSAWLPKAWRVVTPSAIAAVRGTEFFISVEGEKTLLTIFEGEVLASNPTGSLALTSGQSAGGQPGSGACSARWWRVPGCRPLDLVLPTGH